MNNIDFTALSVFDLYDEEMNPVIPFNPRNTNGTRIHSMSDEELAASPYIPYPYDEDGYGECKFSWHQQEQTCNDVRRNDYA